MYNISVKNFQDRIMNVSNPVLLLFYSENSISCKLKRHEIIDLLKHIENDHYISFVQCDVWSNRDLVMLFEPYTVPSVFLIKGANRQIIRLPLDIDKIESELHRAIMEYK